MAEEMHHRQGSYTTIKLKISGIVIEIQSRFLLEAFTEDEQKQRLPERFNNFFYTGKQKPHISIKVRIVDKLPQKHKTKHMFITYHFQDNSENWRLQRKGHTYIYKSPLEGKEQLMVVNKTFDRVTAHLLPKEKKGYVWRIDDIIYDFLQILLINYFALRKEGIFVHGVGVKDLNKEGLLFAGKSGCGKTTSARLWHRYSKAIVLNDDRIIVRKLKGKFFIYGSPWHGEFRDYFYSRIESAPLKKLFFIYHAPKNNLRRILQKEAFSRLYPALFPPFWDKKCLENIVSFCQDLLKSIPSYRMGFVKNKNVIGFVRGIK